MSTHVSTTSKLDWRFTLLGVYLIGSLVWVMSLSPMPQDQAYHDFADQRAFLGIPHCLNVVSNVAFLLTGLLGLRTAWRSDVSVVLYPWLVLFLGVLLTSVGSGYYHWYPSNASLVWDRLPMTLGFMGLFVALVGEFINWRWSRVLLIPSLVLGVGAVIGWHLSDDLRLYTWVQVMPLGLVVVLLTLYRLPFTRSWLLLVALAWYILAKVCEHFDSALFYSLRETLSGHSLKHLFAAAGCYTLVVWLQKRKRR